MRYELNFDEDKVNDVLVVGGASYDLKGCVDLLNEQDKTIKNQEQRIKILQQEIQSAQQIGTLLSERLKGFCGDVV